jgi:hypothetical protein
MSVLKKLSRRSVAGLAAGILLAAGLTTIATVSYGDDDAAQVAATVQVPVQSPVATEQLQLTESGVRTVQVETGAAAKAAGKQEVCAEPDAQWLRIRFADLSLAGKDSVTVTGSTGTKYTVTATNWRGKAFYTRAFAGRCVTLTSSFASAGSSYAVDSYQSGIQPLPAATVTVAAAGDICGSACNQTRPLVESMNPTAVITAGDNAYESGTLSEFNNSYHPQWGVFKSKTYPSPGNHEYITANAKGYFDYFNGVGQDTGRAGDRDKGYYSYDVGDWHFVALNSNIARTATSAQVQWLRADLAASTKPCTAAYWHHSRFAAGNYSDNTSVQPFFQALYDYKADLVISGHDHNYIRFAPSKPDGTKDAVNGVRQFLIGTGGRALYGSGGTTKATIEKKDYTTFGVGKLTLTATSYQVDFVPVAGRTFTDTIQGTCHAK